MFYLAIRTGSAHGLHKITERQKEKELLNLSVGHSYKYFNSDEEEIAKKWLNFEKANSKNSNFIKIYGDTVSIYGSEIIFSIDFEFDLQAPYITYVGLVVTDVHGNVLDTYESGVHTIRKLSKGSASILKITDKEYDDFPNIEEVSNNILNLYNKYGKNKPLIFCWGNADKVYLIRTIKTFGKGMNCKSQILNFANSMIDLQNKICIDNQIDQISLENALVYTDYNFKHDFDALSDALAVAQIYKYAAEKDAAFYDGLVKFKIFYKARGLVNKYNSIERKIAFLQDAKSFIDVEKNKKIMSEYKFQIGHKI